MQDWTWISKEDHEASTVHNIITNTNKCLKYIKLKILFIIHGTTTFAVHSLSIKKKYMK